jgi:hypothetical protein
VTNLIAAALVQRILEAARSGQKFKVNEPFDQHSTFAFINFSFKVIVVIPELPGFAGDVKSDNSLKTIMAAQYRTINRGGCSIYEEIRREGYDPFVIFVSSALLMVLKCFSGWTIFVSTTSEPMTELTHLSVSFLPSSTSVTTDQMHGA